jgi:RNA polymerase sigma factor (sigma-70 family)
MADRVDDDDPLSERSREFRRLHDIVRSLALPLILPRVDCEADAQEVLQQISVRFEKKWRRDPSQFASGRKMDGYVATSVRNALTVFWRGLRRLEKALAHYQEVHGDPQVAQLNPLEELELKERKEMIGRALDTVSPRARAIYLAVRDLGLSYQQVAEQFGVVEKTVENTVNHVQGVLHAADLRYMKEGL